MKAKEYFAKYLAVLAKDADLKTVCTALDECLTHVYNECVEQANVAKLHHTQVVKFRESNAKWKAIVGQLGKHLEINKDYVRPIGDTTKLDMADIEVLGESFIHAVGKKVPSIHRAIVAPTIAHDRMPKQNEMQQNVLQQLRMLFGPGKF